METDNLDNIAGASRKLWISGRFIDEDEKRGTIWDFNGIFSTKARSIEACRNEKDFIFSCLANELNQVNPILTIDLSFPIIEEELNGKI